MSTREPGHRRRGFARASLARLAVLLAFWGAFLGLQSAKSRFPHCSGPFFGIYAGQVRCWTSL